MKGVLLKCDTAATRLVVPEPGDTSSPRSLLVYMLWDIRDPLWLSYAGSRYTHQVNYISRCAKATGVSREASGDLQRYLIAISGN